MPALWMLAGGELDADVADAQSRRDDGFISFKIKAGSKTVGDDVARRVASTRRRRLYAITPSMLNGPAVGIPRWDAVAAGCSGGREGAGAMMSWSADAESYR